MPNTLQGEPIDQRTDALDLPLPHIDNWHEDDVPRLRAAFVLIDTALQLMGLDMDSRDDALSARLALLEWAGARSSSAAYTYDAEGRITAIAETMGGQARTTTFTFDAQGRVATSTYTVAGGATRTETYQYHPDTGMLTGMVANEVENAP
ncbi:MAG: RHS repeat domain-containing protein [Acidovorax sp.]|uniref:RHS repeat domain-containing protein n=1 Tax=Acidovorax sp. TaxID=1872122 RepID=UPI0039189149